MELSATPQERDVSNLSGNESETVKRTVQVQSFYFNTTEDTRDTPNELWSCFYKNKLLS